MFAVPGWAVSPKALVQKPKGSSETTGSLSGSVKAANAKKRKRHDEGDLQRSRLSGADLEKLWNQTFGHNEKTSARPTQDALTKHSQSEEGQRTKSKSKVKSRIKDPPLRLGNTVADQEKAQSLEGGDGRTDISKTQKVGQLQSPQPSTEHSMKKYKRLSKQERNRLDRDSKPNMQPETMSSLPPPPSAPTATLTPLQAKMRNKLTSARFRHLNQILYTTSSTDALDLFKSSPDLFAEYHNGFSQQVKDSWPQNPVNMYIQEIKQRGVVPEKQEIGSKQVRAALPRRKTGSCTIADLGCGDAPLARGCQSQIKALKLKFHNFDLHTPNSHVTVADISNLPLRDGEADIAIFCLSLMGTNWIAFVEEAWRILRGDGKGEVWVSEVKSRFGRVTRGRVVENSVGKKRKQPKMKAANNEADSRVNGEELFAEDNSMADQAADETDISAFVKVFARRGFQLRDGSTNKNNKMFVSMTFIKSGIPTAGKHKGLRWNGKEYQKTHDGRMKFVGAEDDQEVTPEEEAKVLKPCVYKTR